MEALVKEISNETIKSLEKSGKLPFPLYYREVFNNLVREKGIKDTINPKLLDEKPYEEKFINKMKDSLDNISSTTNEIRKDSEEFVEEIDEIDSEEIKNAVIKFSFNLINQIKKMEKKVAALQEELNKVYKEMLMDPLTKVLNRKALEKDKENIKGIVCVIDVDDFKQINDNYGHLVGDFTLIKMCEIIKKIVNNKAKLYRYGGDEFILVFDENVSLSEAEQIIKKIVEKISKTKFKYKNHLIGVTISVGMSKINNGETLEEVLKRADKALYNVKNNNKNNFKVH